MEIYITPKGVIFCLRFDLRCGRIEEEIYREGVATMEIKEQIEKMAKKVLNDKELMELFRKTCEKHGIMHRDEDCFAYTSEYPERYCQMSMF